MRNIIKYLIFTIGLAGLSYGQSVEINGQKVEVGQEDLVLSSKRSRVFFLCTRFAKRPIQNEVCG